MAPERDQVRARWAAGEVALNAWLSLEGASSASVVSAAGFDAATVDLQHGAASLESLAALVAAIESSGAVPFARVPWNDPAILMRVLDLGVRGVICPMVESADEATAFVRACRYPPAGARSYGPVRSAFGAGRQHTEAANRAVLLFAQIETAAGLSGVEEICGTPGLDGVYVGPADLSLTLGLETFADLRDAHLLEALDRIVAAAAAVGIVPGIHAPSDAGAVEMARRGFRFVGCAGDADLLRTAAGAVVGRIRDDLRT
jgi:4-hydroxy-2-oxoheptanedioate aldolase